MVGIPLDVGISILCHLWNLFATGDPYRRSSSLPEKHADWWVNLTSFDTFDRRIRLLTPERSLSDRHVIFQGILDEEYFGY